MSAPLHRSSIHRAGKTALDCLAFAAWRERIGDALYGGVWHIGPWELHPLVLLFVLSGTMMISRTLRIPKW